MTRIATALILSAVACTNAFAPAAPTSRQSTELHFGIPTFGAKDSKEEKNDGGEGQPEKKIGMSGLVQLITAGMGSPFLGDFEGVDEETGKMMFSLEANNLVDKVRQALHYAQERTCSMTIDSNLNSVTGRKQQANANAIL